MLPDLKMGIILAILSDEGTLPEVSERLKMWVSGLAMEFFTFFRMEVEMPDMSGVLLSSSSLIQAINSSGVSGEEAKSSRGMSLFWGCGVSGCEVG